LEIRNGKLGVQNLKLEIRIGKLGVQNLKLEIRNGKLAVQNLKFEIGDSKFAGDEPAMAPNLTYSPAAFGIRNSRFEI
jgi:hypothetical protein